MEMHNPDIKCEAHDPNISAEAAPDIYMSMKKIERCTQRLMNFNRALDWCNKNLTEAMKNIDKFEEKYAKPLDEAWIDLNDAEKEEVESVNKM